MGYATERHAGTKKEVCTCVGNVDLQMGRDLTTVRKVVGSGGWLSRASRFDMHHWLKYRELNDDGKRILLPTEFEYYRDSRGYYHCWQTSPESIHWPPRAPVFNA